MGPRFSRPPARPAGPAQASSTAAAIGAATRPPVCSLAPSWPSTSTATATWGTSPSGPAKPMIQACERGGSVPSWAVPVLPPTTMPSPRPSSRREAVPSVTTETMASRSSRDESSDMGVVQVSGS